MINENFDRDLISLVFLIDFDMINEKNESKKRFIAQSFKRFCVNII